jgi:hypothetical protein
MPSVTAPNIRAVGTLHATRGAIQWQWNGPRIPDLVHPDARPVNIDDPAARPWTEQGNRASPTASRCASSAHEPLWLAARAVACALGSASPAKAGRRCAKGKATVAVSMNVGENELASPSINANAKSA